MATMPIEKYQSFEPVELPDRQWPSKRLSQAPMWCSVDLRDGNQALVNPMDAERKMRMFRTLTEMGFKEIEIGFPAASQTDFDFCRKLVEEALIPDDVTIQVLTQARDELIDRTFDSIRGARRAIVHLYNSTSTLQRRVVFGLDREGIKAIAVNGARRVRKLADAMPETEVIFEYSPESFTGTELDFALDVCESVADAFGASARKPTIINLPATVEMSTPNIYADQIEWFSRNFRDRERIVLSLHPHNDRGTGVAAAELGLLAGADRVEGTLFGNGERTGNVDVVNIALNLFTQGIDPELELSDIDGLKAVAEHCNELPVHPRHPYAGELVYTAFSGSHQDAIKKGMAALEKSNSGLWEVPYLPIDPQDVGRNYEAIIRVNSQSGKGGIAYLLQADYGLDLPRNLQISFSRQVQEITDRTSEEISSGDIWKLFCEEYIDLRTPFELLEHWSLPDTESPGLRRLTVKLRRDGEELTVEGRGNGPIDALSDAIARELGVRLNVTDYKEHAIGAGADTSAVAYIELEDESGEQHFGVGRHQNITVASLSAMVCGLNRVVRAR